MIFYVAVYAQRGARVVRSTSTKALEPRNLNNQGTTGVAADTLKKYLRPTVRLPTAHKKQHTARARASRNGDVHLFVCLCVCLSPLTVACLSQQLKQP